MRALGLMQHLTSKYSWNTHLFSACARQGHIRPRQSFFAYSALIINFKGVHMKSKIVALAISVEWLIFTNFFRCFTVKL